VYACRQEKVAFLDLLKHFLCPTQGIVYHLHACCSWLAVREITGIRLISDSTSESSHKRHVLFTFLTLRFSYLWFLYYEILPNYCVLWQLKMACMRKVLNKSFKQEPVLLCTSIPDYQFQAFQLEFLQ